MASRKIKYKRSLFLSSYLKKFQINNLTLNPTCLYPQIPSFGFQPTSSHLPNPEMYFLAVVFLGAIASALPLNVVPVDSKIPNGSPDLYVMVEKRVVKCNGWVIGPDEDVSITGEDKTRRACPRAAY